LKRVDIEAQLQWLMHISQNIEADARAVEYHSNSRERIVAFHTYLGTRPIEEGWEALYRDRHNRKFFEQIVYDARSGIYHPPHFIEETLIRIPPEFGRSL